MRQMEIETQAMMNRRAAQKASATHVQEADATDTQVAITDSEVDITAPTTNSESLNSQNHVHEQLIDAGEPAYCKRADHILPVYKALPCSPQRTQAENLFAITELFTSALMNVRSSIGMINN